MVSSGESGIGHMAPRPDSETYPFLAMLSDRLMPILACLARIRIMMLFTTPSLFIYICNMANPRDFAALLCVSSSLPIIAHHHASF